MLSHCQMWSDPKWSHKAASTIKDFLNIIPQFNCTITLHIIYAIIHIKDKVKAASSYLVDI